MKYVTSLADLDINKTYSYADYLKWHFKERVELLWGKIRKMAASPATQHQKVLGKLFISLGNILENHPCQVFIAPFDVRLPLTGNQNEKIENVVQPDLCVVCDENKIDEKGCLGAPDLIIEVLSPTSSTRDMKDKPKLYEQAGVPEYWVVDPHSGIVYVYILGEEGKYQNKYPVTIEDDLISEAIPGVVIRMKEVFPDILNELEDPYGPNVKRW